MGVRGLSTFVDSNQRLLCAQKLHDTKIVIDGNNLYHFLYYQYHVIHDYGGDYDYFARKCKRFFSLLKKCGVEPIIVFDGGYCPDDRKLPTILARLRDRRNTAEAICTTGHGKVMPILAIETFRLVLVELNIPHISCDFEADDDIATLANDFNCPVMSNDSDFFVYDLKGGYIPLDYVNLTLCVYNTETAQECICTLDKELSESEFRYLPVKFYRRDRLSELFTNKAGFVIPLFASLLGNDYLNTSELAQFYSQLKIPRTSNKYFFSPKAQSRLGALIQWLNENEKSDLESYVDFVVGKLGDDQKEDIEKEIYKSVQSYTVTGQYTSVNLASLLTNTNSEKNNPDKFKQTVPDYCGNELPHWFVQRLRMCHIHPMLQNAAILHRTILPCQVEIISEPSTYLCSRVIREITYGILFQSEEHISSDNCIEEYDRDQKNIKKFYVTPAETVDHYGPLPKLSSVPNMAVEERQHLLIAALGLSTENFIFCKDSGFCGDLVLLFGLLSYWVNHAVPKVTPGHLDSVIMSVIILQVKVLQWIEQRKMIGLEYTEPELYPQIAKGFQDSSEKKIIRLEKNLKKYFVKPNHSAKHPANFKIVHGFSQFQACVLDVIRLNQLLQCPFTKLNPSFILNCTLMYNLCWEIETRPNPELFLSEMLDCGSPLCQLFLSIKKQVMQLCNGGCFAEKQTGRKKKSKSKKNAPKQAEGANKNYQPKEDIKKEGTEKRPKLVTNCSVNNRFALLDLSD